MSLNTNEFFLFFALVENRRNNLRKPRRTESTKKKVTFWFFVHFASKVKLHPEKVKLMEEFVCVCLLSIITVEEVFCLRRIMKVFPKEALNGREKSKQKVAYHVKGRLWLWSLRKYRIGNSINDSKIPVVSIIKIFEQNTIRLHFHFTDCPFFTLSKGFKIC